MKKNTSTTSSYTLQRKVLIPGTKIPPYFISVVAQNLTERKNAWAKERAKGLPPRKTRPWVPPPFHDPRSSLIVNVGKNGKILKVAHSGSAHGILPHSHGILNAQHDHIRLYSRDLKKSKKFSTFKTFNDMHTLRKTPRGILAVASGTDAILELTPDGKKILWSWFAHEHGYKMDSYGKPRTMTEKTDHRRVYYTVWMESTHVNSALPFDKDSVLATFFHQGTLVRIDKKTGAVHPIVSGMKRPHATRWSGKYITFVDTVRGKAFRGKLKGNKFKKEHSVRIKTNWLQDAQFVKNMWILVDAEHSRVHYVDRNNRLLAYDQFNPDWDFFEVAIEK